jgi:hypothetical protein
MKGMVRAAVVAMAVLGTVATGADVTVVTESATLMAGKVLSSGVTREMIKGDRSRTVIEMGMKPFLPIPGGQGHWNTIAIYRFDLGCNWILHPEDSSYTEWCLVPMSETTVPKIGDQLTLDSAASPERKPMKLPNIGDQQSLDSALTPEPEPVPWQVDTVVWRQDAHLGLPCRVATARAVSAPSEDGKVLAATFEVWLISDDAGADEFVAYRRRCGKEGGLADNYLMVLYDMFLGQFDLSIRNFALDTVTGIPLKGEIIVTTDLSQEDIVELKAQSPGDDSPIDSMPSVDSVARALDMSDSLKESLTSQYEVLAQELMAGFKPGRMELLKYSQSVVSIDTTALADSLFEIPAGYRKQGE